MTELRTPGLNLAKRIAGAAIGGAALLVALDFFRADDAGSMAGETASIERRLRSVANIDLFTAVDVPGSDLRVSTGTEYADAQALADGRAAERWCYVERPRRGSSFQPHIELGRQTGNDPPVLASAGVAPDQARQLGLSPGAIAALAQRHCRFGR